MGDGSAFWAAMGSIVAIIIGLIGNKWAKQREEKQRAREITTTNNVELERAHEGRPWAEMGRRIEDLKEEIDKLERSLERRDITIDALAKERDKLRVDLVDSQIEVKRANGALARITEIQQECAEERKQHRKIVERLSAEIRRLRGEH